MPEPLHDVVNHLSHPAPLLEDMSINGCCLRRPDGDLILTPTLFSGDLPSLCRLSLENVYTKLPWRNMVNLTSLRLVGICSVSMGQLLDFFESAPRLLNVNLRFDTPTSSDQTGRLVSLAHLEKMSINGCRSSLLLNHLLHNSSWGMPVSRGGAPKFPPPQASPKPWEPPQLRCDGTIRRTKTIHMVQWTERKSLLESYNLPGSERRDPFGA